MVHTHQHTKVRVSDLRWPCVDNLIADTPGRCSMDENIGPNAYPS